jgi:hypothetical protein
MMRSRSLVASVTFLVLFVTLGLTAATAQYRASIQGTVTDEQGAVVLGATVTLTNKETGKAYTATTNDLGIYNFSSLPPSHFSMSVEKAGFKKQSLEDLTVISEQANAVNVQIAVGSNTETVTVSGDATPLIDTETSNMSGTVKAEEFQKLPSFGRDPFQLLQLAPGAFGDGSQGAGGSSGPGGGGLPGNDGPGGTSGTSGVFQIENGAQVSAGGGQRSDNSYQIDGVTTVSASWNGTSIVTPNEDSIKEIKVVTDNYDAENGRSKGAQVQVISQNGTNEVHGSLFFRAHRPGLDAYTKYNGFNSHQSGCKAPCGNIRDGDRYNDYGATVGGPILRNKLFGFFSYETLSDNAKPGSVSGWYETSQYRGLAASGTNAAKFLTYPGVAPNGGTIQDETCAQAGLVDTSTDPVNGNCHFIAGQGLDIGRPLTAPLGTLDGGYKSALSPGTGGDGKGKANNLDGIPDIAFVQNIVSPTNSTHRQFNGRVDFNATKSDLVAFSFYYVPNSSFGINGNGTRLMNAFNSTYRNRAATVLWDHTFGSNTVNEARVNAAGWLNKDLATNPNAPFGLPQTSFNGTGSIGVTGYGVGSFNGFDQWTYAAKDVLTKVHGAHTIKMGGDFTRLLFVDAPFWADRPGYTFNNIWDFLNDAPVQEQAQFDPKTGIPSALRKDTRSSLVGLFVQDSYKLKPNLTVTAGLRWDYFGAVSEKYGKLGTVVLGQGSNLFTGLKVRAGGNQYTPQKTNFGPQFGFAWSPRGVGGLDFGSRLVIRGGIGLAYNGVEQASTLDTRFNPPFVQSANTLSGSQILYINSFPANVHNPNGYAANPNGLVSFDSNNLPIPTVANPNPRVDLTALPATWPTTRDVHYTLGGEYDLGHHWVASAGYQGNTTRHLTQHYNLYNPGSASNIPLNPRVSGVNFYNDNGSAHFNALLLGLRHAFSQSFQVETQYRLSHSVDSSSNGRGGSGQWYEWNLASTFGTSDYDTRHAFKVFGVWSPTIFRGSHNWVEKIAGGWSLSGILNAHTGFPWTPQYTLGNLDGGFDPVFNFGQFKGGSTNDAGSGSILPAKYLGGFHPNYGSNVPSSNPNGGGAAFFTPPNVSGSVLFTCLFPNPDPVACPSGQQGFGPLPTAPGIKRNSFTGPGYFDVDATLGKAFGLPKLPVLGENAKMEIRANFYNLFNKVNLGGGCNQWTGVICDINNANFGQSAAALASRTIEMQARFSF